LDGLFHRLDINRTERIDWLSGGTRQKINLIAALLVDPDVLVLDEPYQGFDHETYLTSWEFAEQARTAGRSVLVSATCTPSRTASTPWWCCATARAPPTAVSPTTS
jgi:ABC-type multidrug transport system ATPase subunit